MTELPVDVWAMMIFTILAFFGVAIWALVYTLRQEEQKMEILQSEDTVDTHSPQALRELRDWIHANPDDPDVDEAREMYENCVEILQTTNRHFYNWSEREIRELKDR